MNPPASAPVAAPATAVAAAPVKPKAAASGPATISELVPAIYRLQWQGLLLLL